MSYRIFWSALALVWLSSSAQAGYIEICKDADPAGSLSGVFDFTIAGQTGTFSTPVGACTPDFQLPDGLATITELPPADTTFVSVSSFPDDRLVSFDAATETAVVLIVPGDLSTETVVTFTDASAPDTSATVVPEPGTAWLIGLGLTLWAVCRRLMNAGAPRGGFFRSAFHFEKGNCDGRARRSLRDVLGAPTS
jgi:hypothetical protein